MTSLRYGSLSDADIDYWSAYIRDLADRMLLRDWGFRIIRDNEPDGVAAVQLVHGQRWFKIKVAESFLLGEPEYQRETLVHELVHIVTSRVRFHLHRELREHDDDAMQMLWRVYDFEDEHATDHLSLVIAESMPLPPPRSTEKP